MNKTFLLGNLGADPEHRQTSNGSVTKLRVATNETWRDARGEKQEHTEWHRVVCFGGIAESAAKYLRKGSKLLVEGKLRTNSWTDKDGIVRYTTEIIADNLRFLGSPGGTDRRPDPTEDGWGDADTWGTR